MVKKDVIEVSIQRFCRQALCVMCLLLVVNCPSVVIAFQPAGTPTTDRPATVPALAFRPADKGAGAYFDVKVDAGKGVTLKVLLGNAGKQPIAVRTYAADGFTGQNGGFSLRDAKAPRSGVTTWVDYPEQTLTLKPGEGVERTLSIAVPADTKPGQYITGLAMETAEALDAGSTGDLLQFKQVLRKVLAVLITVPGEVSPSMTVGTPAMEQEGTSSAIVTEVANTGNVLLKPAGEVRIVDGSGKEVLTAPVKMGSVYAHDKTTLRIGLAQPLPAGDYRISVELHDQATGAKASVNDAKVAVISGAAQASPITISSATATPKPSADKIQFLDIAATLHNDGEQVTNARVVLHVKKDGKSVENFPLATSLALSQGDTAVQNRYIPADGWSQGTWIFSLSLEQVDPGSGAARVIASADLSNSIVVP